ncbi:non-hydrolyzing UDP-N-acetylglucosamine 2-epimerase [Ideonella sp.]|jgi:UDP-GlcNAc3NAcA epimerase|uniref:non-hydrolyzing UDP-N-acetylglucosamine 2-epimerase n=1 Tax=Ideonella sp. TaxID=1929293 RepID=UPI0037BFD265
MALNSKTFKVVTIVGARPQFVKAAALSPRLQETGTLSETIVHTGQHFDRTMSDIFFEEMKIPDPKINLGIGGGSHGQNTGRMIEALERVFIEECPDTVLVYGDTDSTLAAAIAASKMGIKLTHVEAGLRSYRRAMPEEINRVLTDHVSDILYTPCQSAISNLLKEGIAESKIHNAGDVMLDVVRRFQGIAKTQSNIVRELNLSQARFSLMTLHRKENVDSKASLERIFSGIAQSGVDTVFLIHPRTTKMIESFGLKIPANVRVIAPVGYIDMLALIEASSLVMTDSGGLQKEAYFLNKPCVTLREETEWIELVEAKVNVLVGSNPELILSALSKTDWPVQFNAVYGDGRAAERIAEDLLHRLQISTN